MNLDLTSSSSRTQKCTTQKKSYKPRKSNTKNTRKSNISIHFPPPKASHNLSSKKKKKKAVTNLFLSQKSFELLIHCCKPERSPIQPYWRGSPTNFHVPRQLCSSFSSPTKLAQKIKILYFLFFSHIFLASKLINHSDLQNKKTCT